MEGIQVNFCKNPSCRNYGVTALARVARGRLSDTSSVDTYTVTYGGARLVPRLHCQCCQEEPPIKSNQAIAEERARMLAALLRRPDPTCPDAQCTNHAISITRGVPHYQAFGRTRAGSQRYRCLACRRTFAVGAALTGQKQPHKNRTVFALLMNKTPFRRICEVAAIQPQTLYGKIDFLAAQCQAFAADREQRLREGMPIRRLYLGTDCQEYAVNWMRERDRRNVILHAVGTADNATGYVFAMHLNFDPALDPQVVEPAAKACGDLDVRPPFRRYARCWLAADHAEALERKARAHRAGKRPLLEGIRDTYAEAVQREDVEVFEIQDAHRQLPAKGMQIHAEYTLYGHFFYLRELLRGVEKVRFFLDQDSGMRAACLAAFQPEIATRRVDAFYVRIGDQLTVPEKRAAIAASRAAFQLARRAHPGLSDTAVRLHLIQDRMAEMTAVGHWQDKWLLHPFPHMSEPQKAVCYLTDYGDYDLEHLAWLYDKASLHAIDCFLMQVRRRLSLLERPIASASRIGRVWHGYSPYNPESIVKVLTIFRVFYNYCLAGTGDSTPAMRLGLAKGKVTLEDIIYF